MSIFWITITDFFKIEDRILTTEGLGKTIHPLTYYDSDGIMYLYRAFENFVYASKVSVDVIEREFGGIEAFHTEHLSKAINLTQNY